MEFQNHFANPIANGQCHDSTPADVKLMRYRVHVLQQRLQGLVHRRSHSTISRNLPPKHEFVIACRSTPLQTQLSQAFLGLYITQTVF